MDDPDTANLIFMRNTNKEMSLPDVSSIRGLGETGLLPIDALSDEMQDVVTGIADTLLCPRDYVTSAMFTIAGSCMGNGVTIKTGKYENAPCLWMCLVGDPGTGKTKPVEELLEPLNEMDYQIYQDYLQALLDWKRKRRGHKGPKPICVNRIISDITPAALKMALMENPRGLLRHVDQLQGMFGNSKRYKRYGSDSELISLFNSEEIDVMRMGELQTIERPFLAILGGMQPGVLKDTFGNLYRMSVLVPRFLFAFPENTYAPPYNDTELSPEVMENWRTTVERLSTLSAVLTLDDQAEGIYKEFHDSSHVRAREEGGYRGAVLTKLVIQVLRWAGIAHMLGRSGGDKITGAEMDYSVRCMDVFETNARKVYEVLNGGRKKSRLLI